MNRLALCLLVAVTALCGCQDSKNPSTTGDAPSKGGAKTAAAVTKLTTRDTVVGTGPTVEVGDMAMVEYSGKTADGKEFDSNVPADPKNPTKPPFSFMVGTGGVIKGWDQGLPGMKVGGTREIDVPWTLAYGEQGSRGIPPKADLFFTVKLLYLVKPGQEAVFDTKDITVGKGAEVKRGDFVTANFKVQLLNGMSINKPGDDKDVTFQTVTGDLTDKKSQIAIKGLPYGVLGMKVGGVRELIFPAAVAYRQGPPDPIPSDSAIRVTVTLKGVKPGHLPAGTK